MKITFNGTKFIGRCSFEERLTFKRAGFERNQKESVFETHSRTVAARLLDLCDDAAKREIKRTLIHIKPWAGGIHAPFDKKIKPYQFRAAQFALERNRSYLALDPGLGKTIVAATIINSLAGCWVTYVCPPFLCLNVEDEFNKWLADKRKITVYGRDASFTRTLILPDSRLDRLALLKIIQVTGKEAKRRGVEIVLIVDEAHRFNGEKSIRSDALFEDFVPKFDRVIFMSGTPMDNRPMDLYKVISNAAPECIAFMDRFEFGRKYCAGRRNKFGWDFKGASNVDELARRLIPKFMLRVKDTVLNLHPLREEMVFIGDDVPPKIAALDEQLLREYSPQDLLKGKMSPHISTYLRELGALKVKPALPFIKSILEDTKENIIIGTTHRDVVPLLAEALKKWKPLIITGDVPTKKRLGIAKEFQTSNRRLVILNIDAGGIGLNMTKADRILLLEFSWVPSKNKQLIARARRYGRNAPVLAQYMVFRNSLDRKVMEAGFRKKAIIDRL